MVEDPTYDDNILVKELINNFSSQGLEITHANYGGYSKPTEIKNYRPDIVGWDNERQLCHIGIVKKDSEKLKDLTTGEQFYELSNLLMSKGVSEGKICPLHIAVPEKYKAILEQRLVDLGLSNRKNVKTLGV
ncbi:MAG: hypothetical protein ACE5RN_07380 [Nitrosopumilaceae archaeon]